MMGAGRTSGSRVVVIAVAGTIGVAGIGTLYLPFMADRDQMRGMDEDGGIDKKARREMEQYLKDERATAAAANNAVDGGGQQAQQQVKPGSMWSNLRKY